MGYIKLITKKRRRKTFGKKPKKADLAVWSKIIRKRDGLKCLSCSSSKDLHAHHMVSKHRRPKFALLIDNGITLCSMCHMGYGGVHHSKSSPKNKLIKKLKKIFRFNDIKRAISVGRSLRKKGQAKKRKVKYKKFSYKRKT